MMLMCCVWTLSLNSLARCDDRAELQAIADGYAKNRALFDRVECRYDTRTGMADSLEQARAGQLHDVSETMRSRWAADGVIQFTEVQYERYNLVKNTQQLDTPEDWLQVVTYPRMPSLSQAYLRHRDAKQDWNSRVGFSPAHFRHTTLPELGSLVSLADRTGTVKLQPDQTIEGATCKVLQLDNLNEIAVDPARGWLPVRHVLRSGSAFETGYTTLLTEARQLENGGWFPMRQLNMLEFQIDEASPLMVTDVRVSEVRIPTAGEQLAMQARMHEGMTINVEGAAKIEVPQSMVVSAADLPRLAASRGAADSPAAKNTADVEQPAKSDASFRWLLVIAGATMVAVCGLAGWQTIARNRRASSSAGTR